MVLTKGVKRMRKILSFLLVTLVLFSITGCGNKVEEPVKIELAKDNFETYFTVDAQLSDFNSKLKSSIGLKSYEGYANLKVVVSPKKEIKAENVVIKGKVILGSLCWAGNKEYFEISLKLNGEAEYPKNITSGTCSMWQPENPTISRFYDYKPQENEFLVNDEKILITSITGNIFELK